jgi:hypothetical protein
MIVFIPPASATDEYTMQNGRNCVAIAEFFSHKFNTEMYIISWDRGCVYNADFSAHVINSKIINGHRYFIEFNGYGGDTIYNSVEDIKTHYNNTIHCGVTITRKQSAAYQPRYSN